MVPTMSRAATASAPAWKVTRKMTPVTIGMPTASTPGSTISRSAPRVTMSTQRR